MGKDHGDSRMHIDLRLHAFLMARVQEMRAAIQQKATADFNTWLVGSSQDVPALDFTEPWFPRDGLTPMLSGWRSTPCWKLVPWEVVERGGGGAT